MVGQAWGLVVATDDADRTALEHDLLDVGYDVASFATCRHALAWLEEETPRAAVLRAQADPDLHQVFHVLSDRGVGTVAGLVLVAHDAGAAPAGPRAEGAGSGERRPLPSPPASAPGDRQSR